MSAHKMKFHCIRYVTPSFLALNFMAVLGVRSVVITARRRVHDGVPG
jgi:hypothetical protein